MITASAQRKVTIIGAGLGGSLMAIYLAKKGFDVEIYERRGDLRKEPVGRGRSINMTLATRGMRALDELGLCDTVMQMSTPLKGRIIHTLDGSVIFQPYGKDQNEVIHAVMRNDLNITLLNKAQTYPNVKMFFHKRCVRLGKEEKEVHLVDEQTSDSIHVKSDLIIGADGAFSTIRQQMHRGERATYSQDFLDWGYKELNIPPNDDGSFRIDANGLHMWPRGDCLLMAMPNRDCSFTCTCILSFTGKLSFATVKTPADVLDFFNSRFPDAVPLIPNLVNEFLGNPSVEMVTTRMSPWNYKDHVVLLGDACHAMVPFYGQGMNAAFEDCAILNECIEQHRDNWESAIYSYQARRKSNTDALAELSKQNFSELRVKIQSPFFIARKKVDVFMNRLFPQFWEPVYTTVAHTTKPIADSIVRNRRRNLIAKCLGIDLLLMTIAGLIVIGDLFQKSSAKRKRKKERGGPPSIPPYFNPNLPRHSKHASINGSASDA